MFVGIDMKTMNLRTVLKGEAAETAKWIIRSGRAANKTAALRLAVLSYHERHLVGARK